ncbi:hypothetical protein OROMI_016006 [Orobanche minor]
MWRIQFEKIQESPICTKRGQPAAVRRYISSHRKVGSSVSGDEFIEVAVLIGGSIWASYNIFEERATFVRVIFGDQIQNNVDRLRRPICLCKQSLDAPIKDVTSPPSSKYNYHSQLGPIDRDFRLRRRKGPVERDHKIEGQLDTLIETCRETDLYRNPTPSQGSSKFDDILFVEGSLGCIVTIEQEMMINKESE